MHAGEEVVGVEPVAVREQPPVPLDDGARVDERPVHVEQHRAERAKRAGQNWAASAAEIELRQADGSGA